MTKEFNQFETDVLMNLEQNNLKKIVKFLSVEVPDYIDDILKNYLDLCLINYDDFVKKYNILKEKYGYNFLDRDVSLLEQLYFI